MFPHHFNNSIQYETSADASSSSFVEESLRVATGPLDEDLQSQFNRWFDRWFGNGETSSLNYVQQQNRCAYNAHSRQPGVYDYQAMGGDTFIDAHSTSGQSWTAGCFEGQTASISEGLQYVPHTALEYTQSISAYAENTNYTISPSTSFSNQRGSNSQSYHPVYAPLQYGMSYAAAASTMPAIPFQPPSHYANSNVGQWKSAASSQMEGGIGDGGEMDQNEDRGAEIDEENDLTEERVEVTPQNLQTHPLNTGMRRSFPLEPLEGAMPHDFGQFQQHTTSGGQTGPLADAKIFTQPKRNHEFTLRVYKSSERARARGKGCRVATNEFADKIRKATSQHKKRPSKCDILTEALKMLNCKVMPEPPKKAAHPTGKRESEEENKDRKSYNNSELRRFENQTLLAIVEQTQPAGDEANGRPRRSKMNKMQQWKYTADHMGKGKDKS